MDIITAMQQRHSVRSYLEKPLEEDLRCALQREIDAVNRESGLHIQLITDEPRAFDSRMAHYGRFSGVRNYFALIGKKDRSLDESCGYYGQHLVLFAQRQGLNTCWTALTYKKIPGAFQIAEGEKLTMVIALGYGAVQGVPHRSKKLEAAARLSGTEPAWFLEGVKAALLAPTAMNQQKFTFALEGKDGRVSAKAGMGFYTKTDLGIVKYHFELGAGKKNFQWA